MKSTDLRVGNLVLHNKQIFEIYDIISTQDSIVIGQGDDTVGLQEVFISEVEPIQLTEEILLKAGFIKILSDYEDAETYDFYNDILYFDMADQGVKINGKYCLGFTPDYLHQLQNLYFALTGQELKTQL